MIPALNWEEEEKITVADLGFDLGGG